jgi:hypothetical protein
MLTTAALMRSATSAKFTTEADEPAGARAGLGRSVIGGLTAGSVRTTGVRDIPPAMMTPTRNATEVDNASVMSVNRLDIVFATDNTVPLGLRR